MKHWFLFALTVLYACNDSHNAQQIVDATILASGSNKLSNSKVEFIFRDKEYGVEQKGGTYEMVRLWENEAGEVVRDEVTNEGFKREVNGQKVEVADSMAFKYTNSINSVIYFALLPYRLNDQAVNKEYLGKESIKNNEYHKVQVTFNEEGGGKDHDDVFIYWINTDTNFIDYLAYSYKVDGGGMRFRESYNPRVVNGVRFVDYVNYEPEDKNQELESIGQAFNDNKLKELSKIVLANVLVETY
ncbi:DUF6503 family protein [Fulvivirga lutea]|uniref:Deoxyribose-phosphate aldolase n=1 Tax=Fulvivirga lutea TaxID=2810512 RepID=A0A975A1J1_9BACT|nr:DUF6503 family protein [Fulvivirga lutea]QSE97871.1 hypothetical protein JR347_01935 [Fulvivirga lutea]